ncbi:hypothetical protein L6452_39201 [Arctium lappa]|uniref:Uncharacterized protein n=1 Tax=Arctium lappa TaxID=4217 RepID=A0ACB8XRM1_ARCLA|nr:hypothetical protein L6452_39201 [Arctium lappa]
MVKCAKECMNVEANNSGDKFNSHKEDVIGEDKCEDMNRVDTHKSLSSVEREYEIHKLEVTLFLLLQQDQKLFELCSQGGNKTIQALKKADLAPEVLMAFFVNHHSLLNRWVILALSISQSILHIILIRR